MSNDKTAGRPKGSNADEWHLFLCEHLDNRVTSEFSDPLSFMAVQIAEAIDEQVGRCRIQAPLAKARSRTLMAAKNFSRLMAEFDGELKYCQEALTEVLDAADQLEAIEQAMEAIGE